MSESAYETNRLRCNAVIRAGLGTSKELGKYLLPDQDEHQAQTRVNEWRRGARPRDTDIVLRWMEWTEKKWKVKGAKKAKLETTLAEMISEQQAMTDQIEGRN